MSEQEPPLLAAMKAALLADLTAARANLWSVLAAIDAEAEIFPGWNQRDFFAHIGGWEAMAYGAFRDHLAGVPGTGKYPFADMDEVNAHLVKMRQSFTMEDAKLECEINRYAIERMLHDIPAQDYDTPVSFPWGDESSTSFVRDSIKHENGHAEEIRRLRKG